MDLAAKTGGWPCAIIMLFLACQMAVRSLSALSATTLWTFTHLNCFVGLGLLIGLGLWLWPVGVVRNLASQFVLGAKSGSRFLVALRAW